MKKIKEIDLKKETAKKRRKSGSEEEKEKGKVARHGN